MSVFKCKMCGGTIEFEPGATVGTCDSCGTTQTLPRVDDDVIANLHNRANTLRLKCEFDKAEEIYNKILEKNPDDAEAHWGIILCKYGIEYVEDPKTYKRIPTCHRTSFDAILADDDYKAAMANGDGEQRHLYESEAKAIDRIQKDILSIVKSEKPFDVFICYKETDFDGKRTQDSVIANDIYYQLTQEGFKVFYAAITLEDKLGQEYEPYIFAALNSAKVMLVIGSKPEYFSAVWVKNEWSRFLKLMKTDRQKLLIPCYRDMDAYELPEEFAHLQAQDMSKIGFINDLVRGIKKVTAKEESRATAKETVVVNSAPSNGNITPLLKRAFLFLEDGKWEEADEYCERVLDKDPECAEAYLGKLLAEQRVKKAENLAHHDALFDDSEYYQKAIRFGDQGFAEKLTGYLNSTHYEGASDGMKAAKTEKDYLAAAVEFEYIGDFWDSLELAKQCREKAEECRKNEIYSSAKAKMSGEKVASYEEAIKVFQTISGWKDSDEQIYACQKKIEEIKAKEEAYRLEAQRKAEAHRIAAEKARKKRKKRAKIFLSVLTFLIVIAVASYFIYTEYLVPMGIYNDAIALKKNGKYDEAITALETLDGFKDSENQIIECQTAIKDEKYDTALAYMDAGKYSDAILAFLRIIDYKDSANKIDECETAIKEQGYVLAMSLMSEGKYSEAIVEFKYLFGYKDSKTKIAECETAIDDETYARAVDSMNQGKYEDAIHLFSELNGYKDSKTKIAECETAIKDGKYNTALGLYNAGKYTDAISAFQTLNGYKDSKTQIEKCNTAIKDQKYTAALALYNSGKYTEAISAFQALNGYKDSETYASNALFQKQKSGLASVSVGSTIKFGAYEQDNNTSNGKEEIEWQVLAKEGTKILVISKYALDCKLYNTSYTSVTWESCSLRTWLNGTFYNNAFGAKQQEMIKKTTVSADKNPSYSTNPGNATSDNVFLLSITEVNKYFSSDEARKCVPTAYAIAQGVYTRNGGKATCWWWLRSPGDSQYSAALVNTVGSVYHNGEDVYIGNDAVRPAMWIDLP